MTKYALTETHDHSLRDTHLLYCSINKAHPRAIRQ